MNKKAMQSPPHDYRQFLMEVKERVRSAQYQALKAVNTELVGFIGILVA